MSLAKPCNVKTRKNALIKAEQGKPAVFVTRLPPRGYSLNVPMGCSGDSFDLISSIDFDSTDSTAQP